METCKPNLFIIGAPKSGTTAMCEYLHTHPDIFVSSPKEPHYFSTDLNYRRNNIQTKEDYLSLFKQGCKKKFRCEASVWYLFSEHAVANILKFNPTARIVVMIRNPIAMAPSLHQQLYYSGIETEANFNKAWGLQADRQKGLRLPASRKCTEPKFLYYSSTCRVGAQLERVMQLVPKEQLHIIVFDDFVNDTKREYEKLMEFLEVPTDNRGDFPIINPATHVRSQKLHALRNNVPHSIMQSILKIKSVLGIENLNILKKIERINTKTGKFEHISENTRTLLKETFRSDIHLMERLLHRDFTHWLN